MKKLLISFILCLFSIISDAQYAQLFPTSWFTGMKWNKVQIIVRGDYAGFNKEKVRIQYPGVQLLKVHTFENSKYLALDVNISSNAKPGNISIEFIYGTKVKAVSWPLQSRRKGRGKQFATGVTSADFVYLLMPDRFSNGNPTNDKFSDLLDTSADRNNLLQRHGGDLQGVTNHLDYFKELGVTALWLCPVLENNMPLKKESAGMLSGYHGYWFTNQYIVDKRFGGNEAYKQMIDAAHSRGLKIIQDAVYNHIGIEHWMYKDAPAKDWVNQWQNYTGSNHRDEAVFNSNGSENDKKIMLDGWFVPHLPDVNQRNPFVANFLIQHAIWTTEEFGIDAWRVDTYKYCDELFLNRINDALLNEYPSLTLVGEAWTNTVTGSAYFTKNNMNAPFTHNMQGVTDFPLNFSMMATLNQPFGWTEGVNRLYMTMAQDILYKNPMYNYIFLDNHDMDRFYSVVGEDMDKYKQGIGLLLTLRGIPQLYYGTEILMKNVKNPSDAMVRFDFPGGFVGDVENKFTVTGRNAKENEAFNFVKSLAGFRKNSTALQSGKTMQFIPNEGLFVYFRYNKDQTIMCILNTSEKERDINFSDFIEQTKGFSKAKEVISNTVSGKQFKMPAKKIWIMELIK